MWPLALIPGLVIGFGIAVILAQMLPTRPQLADALQRLGTTTSVQRVVATSWEDRIGSWVLRHLPSIPGLAVPERDLRLVGTSATKFYATKTRLVVLAVLTPFLAGVLLQAMGILPIFIPGLIAIGLAAAAWLAPDIDLKASAARSREEFARAVAVYLELVAAERKRGATPTRALETAANVGKSWVFVRIRQKLIEARYAGQPPWDALTEFSEEIGVPELADVAKIMRLSGEEGATVYDTLRNRGRSLRVQLLTNEQTRANEASERMASIPAAVLAAVFMGIILTPLILNLLSS